MVVLTRPGTDQGEIDSNWNFPVIDIPAVDVSAEEIRLRILKGEPVEGMISSSVEEYILSVGLYRD